MSGIHRIGRYRIAHHAYERAVQMHVTPLEVERCLLDPEVRYQQSDRDGEVLQHGRIAVVLRDDETVVTILWRTNDTYRRTVA